MNLSKISPKLIIGILIAVFFGVSLFFRIALPYDQVVSGDWIKFTSNDAYSHMRLVDNLVHNFPHLTSFDPYAIYPGGDSVSSIHFFDTLLAFIIWVIGLGSPGQHTIDIIGAYFPAILAALAIIPVYFIGKALFNRWAGVLAAGLTAVLPGEFMGRSILGFTDHHVAETLFSTAAVLFLILAIKEAGQRQMTFAHLRQRDWKTTGRPLVYSLLAGVFLGTYLSIWQGGLLFVFIISLYFIVQFIIDHLRQQPSDHLCIIGVTLFLIALIIFLPSSPSAVFSAALAIALFIPVVLSGVSRLLSGRKLKPAYYPLALIVIGAVFMAVFYAAAPETLTGMLVKFSIFAPAGATATTTLEMAPFLSPQGSFSTAVAWGNFTTSFFLVPGWPIPGFALISFVVLVWLFIKNRGKEETWLLFLTWTLVMLVLTLVQRRFAYYLVVNIALLSAYLSWQAIWWAGARKLATRPEEIAETARSGSSKAKLKKRYEERQGFTMHHLNAVLAVIVVFILVFLFNIIKSKDVAAGAPFAPSDAWQSSLVWMKDNTPDPFGDPDAYNKLYDVPPPGEDFNYPESAYGVTAWWDYGYWITRIARRLPSANPSQNPVPITRVATLFLSGNETLTDEIMGNLGSSYIIADYEIVTSKFWAIVTWSGQEQGKFAGVYYIPFEGRLVPVQLFYPAYYRTLLARLYNFDGKGVTDEKPMVVTYDEKADRSGIRYKQITGTKEFSSYQEALDYVAGQKSGKHDIVGTNPFISPVSLEAVPGFRLTYASEYGMSTSDGGKIPEVKIFEYRP